MLHLAKKFDHWLHSHLPLLLALLLLLILRLPNFFEPYWYGDEGIYLTIGNAIRDGEQLYTQIIDHKTPLIYFLAAVPNQLSFRTLTVAWMMLATCSFYAVGKKLFKKRLPLTISTFLFVILTSVPWFEGNIPNGELFVMGFVWTAAWILSTTRFFELLIEKKRVLRLVEQPLSLLLAGILFGLAILTKVPAVLDVIAWLTIGWFILSNRFNWLNDGKKKADWWQLVGQVILHWLIILAGVAIPILASVVYFSILGSAQDYLQYGLLYNFRYAATWGLPFNSFLLRAGFTLQGKVVLAGLVFLLLTIKRSWFTPAFQLATSWFVLALVAALLSNRPYPHYFLQLMPALVLMVGLVIEGLQTQSEETPSMTTLGGILVGLFISALVLLNFGTYPTWSYYQRFVQLVTGQISTPAYRQLFNVFMADNYHAADTIRQSQVKEIFIWGTNPMLYALSDTQPTGQFTVSFHIKDFNAQAETMEAVRDKRPLFIVVMTDESESLPGLDQYLEEHYVINADYEYFDLWKRLPDSVSQYL